jgi:serine/threonine-protein kinase HipA
MVAAGDRLTVPLGGALGDWIVKFPDATFPHLPVVEFATMELARRCGIEVPDIRLQTREGLPDTPDALWRGPEDVAYAIRRFDRAQDRSLVHIEDLAQVAGLYPENKYEGTCEHLAALVHRGEDDDSLRELVRRLTLNILVDNSDAHFKNWSLLYSDPRRPKLSPAYDLVAVCVYSEYAGKLALSLAGQTAPTNIRLSHFDRLGVQPGLERGALEHEAEKTIRCVLSEWESVSLQFLGQYGEVSDAIKRSIQARAASLLAK